MTNGPEVDDWMLRRGVTPETLRWTATRCAENEFSPRETLDELLAFLDESSRDRPNALKAMKRLAKDARRAVMAAALASDTPSRATVTPPVVPEGYAAELEENPDLARELRALRDRRRAKLIDAEIEAASHPLPPVDFGSLDEILARGEVTKWRVSDFLPVEGRLLLSAQRKAGKTTMIGNLARSLLTGDPFLGKYAVEPIAGSIMILNYEVSGSTLAGWFHEMGLPPEARRRLQIVNLRGRENLLATERGRATLVEMMRATKTSFLVVDVFARAFTGDQNSNSEVATWLGMLDRVATEGGAEELALVAHAGWSASGRTRGASALEDWPDVVASLEMEKDSEVDPSGPRYFKAFGRDVDIEKARLDYDGDLRSLTYTGISRSTARRSKKTSVLVEPVLEIVTSIPGARAGDIKAELRRRDIPHRDGDVKPAVDQLLLEGRLVQRKDGAALHHWTPDKLPAKFRDMPLESIASP